jgi:hypothetical protein
MLRKPTKADNEWWRVARSYGRDAVNKALLPLRDGEFFDKAWRSFDPKTCISILCNGSESYLGNTFVG